MSAKPRVNLILDSLILVAFFLTVASGVNVEDALRSSSEMSGRGLNTALHWHSVAAFTFIGLIVVHQLFHWKWIMSQLKQVAGGSRWRSRGRHVREPEG